MKRSIRDRMQEEPVSEQLPLEPGQINDLLGQVDSNAFGAMQNAVEHYSGRSDNELMQELRQYRSAGAFDDKALQDVAARLAPMLTPEQQQRLFSVIQQL